MTSPIPIGSRREVFWDTLLVDPARTNAARILHHPVPREVVLVHDAPWEGDGCDFHGILQDDGLYRMYYLAWEMLDPAGDRLAPRPPVVAYAESRDGLRWEKPPLGLCAFDGSRDTNILLDAGTAAFDNFSVFKDPRPGCPPDERYKGVSSNGRDRSLWCYTSADGIRFRKGWCMTRQGRFDTLNIAFWDRHAGQYVCYIRDFHRASGADCPPDEPHLNETIRDIRRIVSPDFRTWSAPARLDFGAGEDVPLYTNVVQPYPRADHVLVGFPSRYVERKAWTPVYDQLPDPDRRRRRMRLNPRYGLAVTDCVFMASRDGLRWDRWDEAFLTPGPERGANWVYGDCFPAVGLIETPAVLPGAPPELSLYVFENHWSGQPAVLRRHTIRPDGFVSLYGPWQTARVALRPFVFAGRRLSLNMATSAAGWVRVRLSGDGKTLDSCELFGDSPDRTVVFPGGDVAALAGRPVTLELVLRDAHVYAFAFTG